MVAVGIYAYRQDKQLTKEEEKKFHEFSARAKEFMTWSPKKIPRIDEWIYTWKKK